MRPPPERTTVKRPFSLQNLAERWAVYLAIATDNSSLVWNTCHFLCLASAIVTYKKSLFVYVVKDWGFLLFIEIEWLLELLVTFELGGKRDFLWWIITGRIVVLTFVFFCFFSTNYFYTLLFLLENIPYKQFLKSNDGLCFLFQILKAGNQHCIPGNFTRDTIHHYNLSQFCFINNTKQNL